jgi:hypothetical protein
MDPDGLIEETVEDDNGLAAQQAQVVPLALGLATPSLPDALVNQPYEVQLVGQGAKGPFTFSVKTPAELPPGLTLSPEGLLAGMPTQTGIFAFTIVVEANGGLAEARRTLRVSRTTTSLAITTVQLPAPVRLFAYDARLGAAGGLAPYTWAVVEGELPQGLSLDPSGRISGSTNLAPGTRLSFTLQVQDAVGNVDRRSYTLTVVDAAPFGIQTLELAPAVVGMDYLQQILAANPSGAPVSTPVTWSQSGNLPDGLALEPSTGELLIISGRPTKAGLFRFRIEVVDAQGRGDAVNYVMHVGTVASRLSIDLPAVVAPGTEVSATFAAAPSLEGARYFLLDGQLPPGLTLSEDGALSGTVPADAMLASYSFSVGYGLSRDGLVGLRTIGLAVSDQLPTKSGCSAVGGLEPWELAALAGLAARRRRRNGVVALVGGLRRLPAA